MTSAELYRRAHEAHHYKRDFDSARRDYQRLLSEFPDSDKAGYACTQLQNLDEKIEAAKGLKERLEADAPSTSTPDGFLGVLSTVAIVFAVVQVLGAGVGVGLAIDLESLPLGVVAVCFGGCNAIICAGIARLTKVPAFGGGWREVTAAKSFGCEQH